MLKNFLILTTLCSALTLSSSLLAFDKAEIQQTAIYIDSLPAESSDAEASDDEYYKADAAKFPLKLLNGKSTTLTAFKGKVVLLNVWATWCGPCMGEMPHIVKLKKALVGTPFVVLAVSTDKKLADVKRSQTYHKFPFVNKSIYLKPNLLRVHHGVESWLD